MNVLILSGSFGMGHNSVSKAIKQKIFKTYPHSKVYIQDIIKLIAPKSYKTIYNSFNFLVKHCKGYYNIYHKLTKNFNFNGNVFLENYILLKISELINEKQPDIIISTLPLCTICASVYKRRVNKNIPLITCITDISKHNEWYNTYTDYYFAPTFQIKNALVSKGFNCENIFVTGIPVTQNFINNTKVTEKAVNNNLLIMGGGLGLIPKANDFYRKLNNNLDVKTTIILGNNEELYSEMKGRYPNLNIIGYTNKVAEYMKYADLIVTKPGGVSMFEAIHSELPIICLKPYLNQEKHNAFFIENEGIGKVVWSSKDDLINIVIKTLKSNLKLKYYKNNLKRVKNQFSIEQIPCLLNNLKESI
ncbi:UDP-diphospho-muramoylpentapeptide beta-N-acetylglucosaminyltransferase [Clostridium sp. 'deep sea']|uniref:MGDG synthase family glycosyltransferase n=1 Tax=Clostridium sp. 'deep sea' TaxID=2779445 RepID=UPI0018967604|nr:glycosyltransferase [Clostridium sp. 'deep sea']QOR36100.1 UDP-diphospho-muramoylpentapeptide beta-N-acetylglucosaminyltransferase [Clostridium sp. 'deep sea']